MSQNELQQLHQYCDFLSPVFFRVAFDLLDLLFLGIGILTAIVVVFSPFRAPFFLPRSKREEESEE